MPIELKEGVGGICALEIVMILPDTSAPKERSVIYTNMLPTGISVEGTSEQLCALWWSYLSEDDEVEDEEDWEQED